MGRNKPTHFVTRQKKLAKRLENSGRKQNAVRKQDAKTGSNKGQGGKVLAGGSSSKKTYLAARLETKVKDLQQSRDLIDKLQQTQQRQEEYEAARAEADRIKREELEEAGDTNRNREAENTRRKFYQELRKVVNSSDVLIQVLDARDPDACRNRAIEREVLCDKSKKMILLLNKVDLVPREAAAAWMSRLQREFPTLLFKCGSARGTNVTSATNAKDGQLQSSTAVLGADTLLQLLKNYSRTAGGSKKSIAVGIVGYPNVGKSSVINSLKRCTAVKAGNTAGVTKAYQEVILDSKIRLIDSPGVVFSGKTEDPSHVLRNAVKVEALKDPVRVLELLAEQISLGKLLEHFEVFLETTTNDVDMASEGVLGSSSSSPSANKSNATPGASTSSKGKTSRSQSIRHLESVREFLIEIATSRGQLKRGGAPDLSRAAVLVLKEIACGKFRYHVMPPPDLSDEMDDDGMDLDGHGDGGAFTSSKKEIVLSRAEFNIDELDSVRVIGKKSSPDTASSMED
ncbi:unnamed protein product [Amoebophrya sp. A25]|nr:unnamed protein product [Amoebophrya sp. A25]|eukprot:GSA25T00008155001.1